MANDGLDPAPVRKRLPTAQVAVGCISSGNGTAARTGARNSVNQVYSGELITGNIGVQFFRCRANCRVVTACCHAPDEIVVLHARAPFHAVVRRRSSCAGRGNAPDGCHLGNEPGQRGDRANIYVDIVGTRGERLLPAAQRAGRRGLCGLGFAWLVVIAGTVALPTSTSVSSSVSVSDSAVPGG
eukprot:CAMPEP_0182949722 /NCGR_PEP_ID=MMETSP0105_2-20130417/60404_1 /TAXON_ID=81532 ORGANISM="Acanthoeca-like sp., Strain 10tr" /NCGR_SAMPLE_ID=MMETSP0105_2 /ASSEMBLY_ACC=CAM_ASM_000205 /LENGTH=183 /DNA_ID=CAMNT_0025090023 /DNA_START=2958 /DNA_END=3510 /DNA_ORIENTATION=+